MHCVITGGSQGLGLAIAHELVKEDVRVTLISRRMEALREAKLSFPKGAKVNLIAADVTDRTSTAAAIKEAHELEPINWLFCCAGAAKPGLFVEQDLADHEQGWQLNYQGVVNTAQPALRLMIRDQVDDGRIILIGSTLSCMGMIGYSQYAPTKHAIKGLAECLRQELLPHDIRVHCYLVGTIDTPGYQQENATKPPITQEIEGAESSNLKGCSPADRAKALLAGIRKEQFLITSDWLNDIFRVSTQGTSPHNHWTLDWFYLLLSWIILPLFRIHADRLVKRNTHKKRE